MVSDNTKDRILEISLKLFSDKGYAALSMRDLSEAIGIRASSIYYYFKSKQEIFDALLQRAETMTNVLKATFFQALNSSEKVASEEFVRAGVAFVTMYLQNEQIAPLLHALESERFHNSKANETWQKMLFAVPIEHEAKVFKVLYERGLIKNQDADELAAEYHGIEMLGYFTGDTERMAKALESFYKRVFVGN